LKTNGKHAAKRTRSSHADKIATVNMDAKIRELAFLSMLACFCLGLAWAYDEEMFAAVFAVEAAFAAIEAVYLSL
jgi:hypothetical protein